MAPILRQGELCITSYNISIDRNTSSMAGNDQYSEEDKHALLYIVCTLLFYSLGIMIGIVSYIKREKQDIEQERMFNDFLTSFRGKTEATHYRQLKVQETIERLAEIERKGNKGFNDFNAGSPISHGTKLGKKKRLYKFANLSLIQAPPIVPVNSMARVAASNETESDTETPDPFQNRRLSEVVAEIINNECSKNCSETIGNNLYVKEDKNVKIAFIDYNREPENKELCKESLHSMAESDLYGDKVVIENNTAADSYDATLQHGKHQSECSQDDSPNHYIKTTTGGSIEKSFGVKVYRGNLDLTKGEQLGKETEFGSQGKQKDMKLKWSVTSV